MELAILVLKIFFVRIIDVSLGTARTIIMIKGKSLMASIIGFVEVFIWFMIVREALNTSQSGVVIAISYSLGFAVGTYIGSILSSMFIEGTLGVEVITTNKDLASIIRNEGYAVSEVDVKGQKDEKKYMLIIEIKNKRLKDLKALINSKDKSAFVMVSETKLVQNGYFK